MRKLTIIILMLLPATLFAKNYKYGKLIIASKGNDNISMDKTIVRESQGNISLEGKFLRIDNRHYKLKAIKGENLYKANGRIFRLLYSGDNLAYVEIFNYDKVYSYCINVTDEKGTYLSAR